MVRDLVYVEWVAVKSSTDMNCMDGLSPVDDDDGIILFFYDHCQWTVQ